METKQTKKKENRIEKDKKPVGMRGYILLILTFELACLAKQFDGVNYSPAADPVSFAILLICLAVVTVSGLIFVGRIDGGRRESAAYLNAVFVVAAEAVFFNLLYGGTLIVACLSWAFMLGTFLLLLLLGRKNKRIEEIVDKTFAKLGEIGPASILIMAVILLL